jgi:DNA-binding Xre family transcriptional regulator
MNNEFTEKVCKYIYQEFRPKFKSNNDFALHCGVSEKMIRLIQQGKYNLSLEKFKQICDAMEVKMSEVLKDISE